MSTINLGDRLIGVLVSGVGPARGSLLLRDGDFLQYWKEASLEAKRRQRDTRAWSRWMRSQKSAAGLYQVLLPALRRIALKKGVTLWRFGTVQHRYEEADMRGRLDSMRYRLFGNLIRVVARSHLTMLAVQSIAVWRRDVASALRRHEFVTPDVASALEQLKGTLQRAEAAAAGVG